MSPFRKERACALSFAVGGAIRLAAAALTGCQGGRCVWTHDFAPAFDTADCDVDRCVVVGVPNEATLATFKFALRASVSFVDMPAPATSLRGVGRVDLDERYSGDPGLISQESAELGEGPGMQHGPLGLKKPYPVANAAQLFDGDAAPGAFSLGHDAFADLVIDVRGEPGFLTAPLAQQASRGPSSLCLQPLPEACLSFPVAVQPGSGRAIAIARRCDVDDPQIDANKSIDRVGHWRFGHLDGGVQEPFPVAADQANGQPSVQGKQ
jgi:hypothetical protein